MIRRWRHRCSTRATSTSSRKVVAAAERRDLSPVGIARRKRFENSLDLLRALGLSPAAIEHYRRQARKTRKLPHQLICGIAEEAAEDAGLAAIVMRGSDPA